MPPETHTQGEQAVGPGIWFAGRRTRKDSIFFFNDTATTEIYTLSLHDALPISAHHQTQLHAQRGHALELVPQPNDHPKIRSEEHTSELQSQSNLVCRLLLEKKKARPGSARTRPTPPLRRCPLPG